MGLKADWVVKKRPVSLKNEQLETIQTEAQHGEKRSLSNLWDNQAVKLYVIGVPKIGNNDWSRKINK